MRCRENTGYFLLRFRTGSIGRALDSVTYNKFRPGDNIAMDGIPKQEYKNNPNARLRTVLGICADADFGKTPAVAK